MRKVRDFEAELKALAHKQRALKAKRVQQLGELVLATAADALSIEQLAGVLIEAVEAKPEAKEAWRRRGAIFFSERGKVRRGSSSNAGKSEKADLFAQSSAAQARS